MKKYSLLIISIFFVQKLTAQNNINIGDTLPLFSIKKLINSDRKNISTTDFKNQLLIIDFWSIYCSGCVAALPKMEQLQQEYGDKITILPTTNESEESVTTFWRKNKITKNLVIPSVIEDTLLHTYFKHIGVPHEVWIYKNKVIAITDAEYVNAANIKKVLGNEEINWPLKYDFDRFDATKNALFEIDENQINLKNTPIQYAATSDYNNNVNSMSGFSGGSGIIRNKTNKTVRTFYLNYPIYVLYYLNLNQVNKYAKLNKPSKYGIGPNEVVWEVKDPDKYRYQPGSVYKADWIRENGICFESSYPDTGQKDIEIARSVINDLDHLLGLQVRWEKRKEKVYFLRRINNHINIKTRGPLKESESQINNVGDLYTFRDIPLSTLVFKLNQEIKNPYFFDQSGYTDKVDLALQFSSWKDLSAIRKALQDYGLDLQEEDQFVDKLIFREIKGGLLY